MRLVGTRPERLATIPYRAAGPGGVPQNVQLDVERLPVDRLPAGCDALLAAGDLQGIAPSPLGGDPQLVGIALADYLGLWAETWLLPPAGSASCSPATCTQRPAPTGAAPPGQSSTCGWPSRPWAARWCSGWPATTTR